MGDSVLGGSGRRRRGGEIGELGRDRRARRAGVARAEGVSGGKSTRGSHCGVRSALGGREVGWCAGEQEREQCGEWARGGRGRGETELCEDPCETDKTSARLE